MRIQHLRYWPAFINGIAIISILIGFGVILDVQAQSDKKTVKLADTIRPQIKFSDIKIGQQDIKLGEDFDTGPDWIKNLTFKLENISGKRIVFLIVNVNFPQTRLTGNLMSYGINFGLRPDSKFRQTNPPMLLKPAEILEVSLDREKERIYKFVNERQPIESIQKIELETGFIIFEDRTAWLAGSFLRQDSGDPDLYKHIEDEPQQ